MRMFKTLLTVGLLAAALFFGGARETAQGQSGITEAPTGFDNQTNGMLPQGNADDAETFLGAQAGFNEVEEIADGLGPLYNAQACRECHQTPVSGGFSQVTELRAGSFNGGTFTEAPGGSLINDRAINAAIQERLLVSFNVRSQRASLNVLGDGFVECVDDQTLLNLANNQPPGMRGQAIQVPVLEAAGQTRVGRFGWKNQHASLLSFSADAYLNEMGITSPLQPNENTSLGLSVRAYDTVADPEDKPTADAPFGEDAETFARFIRATKVPPRDTALAATPDAAAGSRLFDQIGCAVCHVRDLTTLPPGTAINGGRFIVPAALGNKRIHPFSDFLLHDVGTGDGIVQNGGPATRNKLRTPPLWGLRTHSRLMHDGLTLTRTDAILRHAGEATPVINNFRALNATQQSQLLTFLRSL